MTATRFGANPADPKTGPEVALERYTESQHGDLSDINHLAQTMYSAGFREAISVMVQFQDLPVQLRRIENYVSRVCHIFEDAGVLES